MAWYSAQMIFEAELDGQLPVDALCEESLRLVWAETEQEAESKAGEHGRANEHSYLNEAGQTVRWRFRCVAAVQHVCE